MLKVAAYLLERTERMNWPEVREAEFAAINTSIQDWLKNKGANSDVSGTYEAEDGADAIFETKEATDDGRGWKFYRLIETASSDRQFATFLSVTKCANRVVVYITMEVGTQESRIAPVDFDPKCPRIVRTLLKKPGPWFHAATQITDLRDVKGFEEGEGLVAELVNPERSVPCVVVSTVGKQPPLPRLQETLTHDLSGLANIFTVDEDASWALTDTLGQRLTCFGGAVRVYWPRVTRTADPFRHPLWTLRRLQEDNEDPSVTLNRFRRQIRIQLMRASALSVTRPFEIDEIRHAASQSAFAEMKARAKSVEDFRELADSYAEENDELRAEIAALEKEFTSLQERVSELEAEKSSLLLNVQNAEIRLRYQEPTVDIEPDIEEAEKGPAPGPPERGAVRFYKKTHSAPSHDILVHVSDCGHSKWQDASSAEKAKKGIRKLEGEDQKWKTIHHCGTCKGGGMWKVRW